MLKKLLKYEFKATARTYGGMYLALLAASVLFAGPLAPRLRDWAAKKDSPLLDAGYAVLAAAVFLVSAAFLIKGTYNPFIYFNF